MSNGNGGNSSAYGNSAQTVEFRKTWDKSEYEKRAKERERIDNEKREDEERKLKGLPPKKRKPSTISQHTSGGGGGGGGGDGNSNSNSERELLQARKNKVNLTGMLGKTQVIQASNVASKQAGFYCKVCDCTVKDSVTYLDHINGKKHQRNLNMSMTVAKDSVDDIKSKLAALKKKKQQPKRDYDFDEQVEENKLKEKQEKEERKRRKKEMKQKKKIEQEDTESKKNRQNDDKKDGDEDEKSAEAVAEEGEVDPDMAAMMGFSGFSTTKN
ncbi:U4/U6.U5 snRNP associated protein [Mycoemilia scoparia]|uniref:U4/U6.U5 snRNP associated protein n=1 Tax=Mycoemilia scoparia TaxID=417184 RepID=A0A9W8DP60_9FUNG|nr:U4/U6.U5 snRNP associated protein [Mycoemilia scoparia]